jgi:hypothetical protein
MNGGMLYIKPGMYCALEDSKTEEVRARGDKPHEPARGWAYARGAYCPVEHRGQIVRLAKVDDPYLLTLAQWHSMPKKAVKNEYEKQSG